MTNMFRLTRCTALALCLPASAAFADLTGPQVWSDWQSYLESTGYTVTSSQVIDGDTLTVSDLNMELALGEGPSDGIVRVEMERLRFVEQGDGSVVIELPDTYAMSVTMSPDMGENVDARLTLDQTDPVMTATGDADNVTYDYTSPSVSMTLTSLAVDGMPIGSDIAQIELTMTDLAYVTRTTAGELRSIEQAIDMAKLDYDIRFADPEGEGAFKLVGAMQGLVFDGNADLPMDADQQDTNDMLNKGFAFRGGFTSAGSAYDLSFSSPDGSGTANSMSEGGAFNMAISTAGLVYDVSQKNVDMNLLFTEFPLPMSFSAAELGTSIMMPLQKSPDAQEFGLGVTLGDLTMSDMIWGLFDPAGQLPRDPMSLVVDLTGQAKVLFDFLDPAQAAILETTGAAPGELTALTLNVLELNAAGASLTGEGDFTFDNSDMVTFDGLPRPTGVLDLMLQGGNGLLDTLVGMGLVPEDDAMGARMMMGMFSVPGDAPDTLTSRIEVTPEGQVLANGQRIR